jgi:hypothetical protein
MESVRSEFVDAALTGALTRVCDSEGEVLEPELALGRQGDLEHDPPCAGEVGDVDLQATGQSGAGGMFRVAVPAFGGGTPSRSYRSRAVSSAPRAPSGSRARSAANRPSSKWTGALGYRPVWPGKLDQPSPSGGCDGPYRCSNSSSSALVAVETGAMLPNRL